MRILCVYPALLSGWASYVKGGSNEATYMNHGLAMLSEVLKKAGHETFLVDLRSLKSWENFEDILRKSDYGIALISFLSCDESFARKATEVMKKVAPDKPIVGGGIHLSVTQTKEYPNIDAIVWGEGEPHILDIVATVEASRPLKPVYELKMVDNLDLLPFADRSLFNSEIEEASPLLPMLPKPFVTMVAGRGCWGKCTFCAPSRERISGKKVRIRSPGDFVDEICGLRNRPNNTTVGSLMIHDDLLGTRKWMSEFVDIWKKRLPRIPFWCQLRADSILQMREFIPDLSDIGLTWVSLGAESGSQRMLSFLKKGTTVEQNIDAAQLLHDNNVNIFLNYILGLPTETLDDINGTEEMLGMIKPEWHSASTYTSYPGSQLYEWIKANDYWVPGDEHYSRIRYPYERKIRGVDYGYIGVRSAEFRRRYTSPLREYSKRKPLPPPSSPKRPLPPLPMRLGVDNGRPKVSIIMPSYRKPEFLLEAIQSMFDQTMKDWELIIFEYSAGFPEEAAARIVCEEARKDPRVRVSYRDKSPNNISVIWNLMLDEVRGEYWNTLDHDNTKDPTFLEEMCGYLDDHPEYDAVVCGFRNFGDHEGFHIPIPAFNLEQQRNSNHIDSGEIMYRTSVLENVGYFDENMLSHEDHEYVTRAMITTRGFGFLSKALFSYRWHKGKRMHEGPVKLKTVECIKYMRAKNVKKRIGVDFRPPTGELTKSQRQVVAGIDEALRDIPFVKPPDKVPDLVLFTGPLFSYGKGEIESIKRDNPDVSTMALLMEDPQAVQGNLEMMPHIDWMVTNDANARKYYQGLVFEPKKSQVLHWNCLSLSKKTLEYCMKTKVKKKYDVCFIGHPYPSRVKFIKDLRGMLPKSHSLALVGDGWKDRGIPLSECFETLGEADTAQIGVQSRIVVCKHRTNDDIGGFPTKPPASVNRGYIEAAYGALVMIDSARTYSSFTDEVVWYDSVGNVVKEIIYYLDNEEAAMEKIIRAKALAVKYFTYRARLARVLNFFRAPRYQGEIL